MYLKNGNISSIYENIYMKKKCMLINYDNCCDSVKVVQFFS